MSLILITNRQLSLAVFLFIVVSYCDSQNVKNQTSQYSGSIFSSGFIPFTSNSSAIGGATKGKISYKLGVQVFVYKQFFISGTVGATYLDVSDKTKIGNYNNSTISDYYLEFGYEFLVSKKIRIGTSITPFGNVRYRNDYKVEDVKLKQKDHGKRFMFNSYLSYNINPTIALFVDYNYRVDKMDIKTTSQLQDDFNKIQYHNIGLGLRIYLGDEDVITSLGLK